MLMGSSTEAEAVEVKQIGGDDVGEREEMESEEMRGGGREGGRQWCIAVGRDMSTERAAAAALAYLAFVKHYGECTCKIHVSKSGRMCLPLAAAAT